MCAGLSAGGAAASSQYELLRLDGHQVKWGTPAAGTGSTVTFALVSRPVHSDDARNCRDMQSMDALRRASGIDAAALDAALRAAFDLWEGVADIRFRRVEMPAKADILIGAQSVPRGVAFADVAYHRTSDEAGFRSIRRALVCLNPEKRWMDGFDGDPKTYDLRYAIAHEIGHAIGLDHPGPSGELMSFRYEERFRELQAGDVAGAVGLYGPSRRPGIAAGPRPAAVVEGSAARVATGCASAERSATALSAGERC